jgi:hypothetical protein
MNSPGQAAKESLQHRIATNMCVRLDDQKVQAEVNIYRRLLLLASWEDMEVRKHTVPKLNMAIPSPASESMLMEFFTRTGIATWNLQEQIQ